MQRAHITQHVPDVLGPRIDQNLLADGSHRYSSLRGLIYRAPREGFLAKIAVGMERGDRVLRDAEHMDTNHEVRG